MRQTIGWFVILLLHMVCAECHWGMTCCEGARGLVVTSTCTHGVSTSHLYAQMGWETRLYRKVWLSRLSGIGLSGFILSHDTHVIWRMTRSIAQERSHVTHDSCIWHSRLWNVYWVMSHVRYSCHIWLIRYNVNESCHTWLMYMRFETLEDWAFGMGYI